MSEKVIEFAKFLEWYLNEDQLDFPNDWADQIAVKAFCKKSAEEFLKTQGGEKKK